MKKIKQYFIFVYYSFTGEYRYQLIRLMKQNALLIKELEKKKKESMKFQIQLAQLQEQIK